MQAVILAAGRGERLRPLTENLPKGLITIEGKTLLEYSLDTLRKNGIKEVIIVVGFCQDAIKRRFGENYRGLKIVYVSNDEYGITGSMYSFSKAKDLLRDDTTLLLESDLLYDPRAVKKVLEAPYKDCILVSELSHSGDEVYICVDDNQKITQLGKNISKEGRKNTVGELVGISKFAPKFLNQLFKKAEEDYRIGELNHHYEESVFAASRKSGIPVYAVLCKDLVWIEIDTEDNLKKAKEQIYPKIERLLKEETISERSDDCNEVERKN